MAKGSQFERDICRRLSLWWTDGDSDSVFWRTSNSGGRATVRSKKGQKTKNAYGDLCAIDPVGQPFIDTFAVEIKRGYSSHTFADLLDKPANKMYERWLKQAERSEQESGATAWLLIVKRDRRDTIIFHDWTLGVAKPHDNMVLTMGENKIVGCKLEDWLSVVSPKDIKRA